MTAETDTPERERDIAPKTLEKQLRELYERVQDLTLIAVLLKGAENDPKLNSIAEANFQLGLRLYREISNTDYRRPIPATIARDTDVQKTLAETRLQGVTKIEGPGEYLEKIRSYGIGAERELWRMNIDLIREDPAELARRADTRVGSIQEHLLNLVASSSQLHGAAVAAIESRNVKHALLLCEAAGDFKPEGETVIRLNPALNRSDVALGAIVELLLNNESDLLLQYLFKTTMDGIYARQAEEEKLTRGFEKATLPTLRRTSSSLP